jgi:hypothetical protein
MNDNLDDNMDLKNNRQQEEDDDLVDSDENFLVMNEARALIE